MRADRLGVSSGQLFVVSETSLEKILPDIQTLRPSTAVVDSIQTIYPSELPSTPGSITQVRESSSRLLYLAKHLSIPIFLVGHVTKEGSIAGPKVLEHMVDTVLYIEGESSHSFRILRAVKNRFGSTNEIGVFEMKDSVMVEVFNPSEFFLSERAQPSSGSIVMPALEGSRPILVELQALVVPTHFGIPRRTAEGLDPNRVSLLVAVMGKRLGIHLYDHDNAPFRFRSRGCGAPCLARPSPHQHRSTRQIPARRGRGRFPLQLSTRQHPAHLDAHPPARWLSAVIASIAVAQSVLAAAVSGLIVYLRDGLSFNQIVAQNYWPLAQREKTVNLEVRTSV